MTRRWVLVLGVVGTFGAGCAAGPNPANEEDVALQCVPQRDTAGRVSPYDSAAVEAGDLRAKICYGRPSARGRTMIGGEAVPYGKLWRTGANEPTIIHLATSAEIAGIALEPGSYSLYTIPDRESWTVIVNRSITQWGHESTYRGEVAEQEVGRATVAREDLPEHVETFTIRSEPTGPAATQIVLEWETTRVRIPIAARAN